MPQMTTAVTRSARYPPRENVRISASKINDDVVKNRKNFRSFFLSRLA